MDVTLPVELSLDLSDLTDEQFFSLCQKNRDFRFERNACHRQAQKQGITMLV